MVLSGESRLQNLLFLLLALYGLVRRITASEFTFSSFGFVWSCQANHGFRIYFFFFWLCMVLSGESRLQKNSEAVIRLTRPYKAKRRKSKF
jgi:hypothetical protein